MASSSSRKPAGSTSVSSKAKTPKRGRAAKSGGGPDYRRVLRVRELVRALRVGRPWSTVSKAEELGADCRTIKRDIQFLRSLGYEIEWRSVERTYTLGRRPRGVL